MTVHALRGYQSEIRARVLAAWDSGQRNVMPVLPTGAGKTVVIGSLVEAVNEPTVCMAHRSELVAQMSTALAREGIRHRIIGSEQTRRNCVAAHIVDMGRSYIDPTSRYAVCSVDTLAKFSEHDSVFTASRWVIDEGHHLLAANKWGRVAQRFKNAFGLAPTATPFRADGAGLGRHADGLIDVLIEGPTMRWMIDSGYLCDYVIACPKSHIDLAGVNVTGSGDYSPGGLRAARKRSTITGDVVQSYQKFAAGKQAVVFDVDVTSADETAAAFRAAGIVAVALSGETAAAERTRILAEYKARKIRVLVNVDVMGEGVDIPAVEAVIFARPTMSASLYIQQWGRALRLLIGKELMDRWESMTPAQRLAAIAASGKPRAIIIDHVGNIREHGLADRPRILTLDARKSRSRSEPDDAIPLRSCENPVCNLPYERVLRACPYCGHAPVPAERSRPEYVDGVLELLDPEVLAQMRREAERVMAEPMYPQGLSGPARGALARNHHERREAQTELRRVMAIYGGLQKHKGRDDSEAQARFLYQFKVDALTAQALSAKDAQELTNRIVTYLMKENIAL